MVFDQGFFHMEEKVVCLFCLMSLFSLCCSVPPTCSVSLLFFPLACLSVLFSRSVVDSMGWVAPRPARYGPFMHVLLPIWNIKLLNPYCILVSDQLRGFGDLITHLSTAVTLTSL